MTVPIDVIAGRVAELRTRIDSSAQYIAGLRTRLSVSPPHGPLARDHVVRLHQETVRLHTLIEAWEVVTGSQWLH